MIPIGKTITAASLSTQRYYDLLKKAGKGRSTHRASNISEGPQQMFLIENHTWKTVHCELPIGLALVTGSGATLVCDNQPGHPINVQVVAYIKTNGLATLAVEETPTGATGDLVVDFAWLVLRCGEWLQKNGANAENPFLCQPHPPAIADTVSAPHLSSEQLMAVKSLLSHPVAYVWGPPGTGKTRYVLAETVAHLMLNGKNVLVAASTNLAVDNALDAILRRPNLPKELQNRVLRIGLPSDKFRTEWPECCEERAFKVEAARFENNIKQIDERLVAGQRKLEIEAQLLEQYSRTASLRRAVETTNLDLQALEREMSPISSRLSGAKAEAEKLAREIELLGQEIASLELDKWKQGLDSLEREQMSLVEAKQQAEAMLSRLGWLGWVVAGKHRRQRDAASLRLITVETTLRSQRETYQPLSEKGAALGRDLAVLQTRFQGQDSTRQHLEAEHERLAQDHARLKASADGAKEDLGEASKLHAQLQTEMDKLSARTDLPTGSATKKKLTDKRDCLLSEWAKIKQDLADKLVLGMTLDGFIGLTMDQALHFDHVIIDEAGYATLAKVIPAVTQNCPVSLLGDHRQLPPIYEGKGDHLSESYWGISALYLEEAFQAGIGDNPDALVNRSQSEPSFRLLERSVLTRSFRFGQQLADLLDRHFYNVGLTGLTDAGTSIQHYDCPPFNVPMRKRRQNPSERDGVEVAVRNWLDWPNPDKGTLAILSPYTAQVNSIRWHMKKCFRTHPDFDRIEVLTVHGSQGREWDTVFFSASDTGNLDGNGPFFSDTSEPIGRLVVNTAISRTKKYLRFFLDAEFWAGYRPTLLTEVAGYPRLRDAETPGRAQ